MVSLSVTLLMILLAVMEGFQSEMIERIRGTSADLKVDSAQFEGLENYETVQKIVESTEGVRATVPYVDTMALVLDLEREAQVGKLDDYIRNYSAKLAATGVPQTVADTLSRDWIEKRLWDW